MFQSGSNCSECESACQLPKGCPHPCLQACHPAPCKPCPQGVKLKCHCGLNQLHRPCHQWTAAQGQEAEVEKLLSCGNQCPRNYDCGHRCQAECHSGDCPAPDACRKKVKVQCPCKRLKKEFACDVVRAGNGTLSCDAVCKEIVQKNREVKTLLLVFVNPGQVFLKWSKLVELKTKNGWNLLRKHKN